MTALLGKLTSMTALLGKLTSMTALLGKLTSMTALLGKLTSMTALLGRDYLQYTGVVYRSCVEVISFPPLAPITPYLQRQP